MATVGIYQSATGHYYFSPSVVHDAIEAECLERRLDIDLDFGARIIGRLLERALDADEVPRLREHGLRPYLRQEEQFLCTVCHRAVGHYQDRRCAVDGQPVCAACYVPPVMPHDEVA